MRVLPEERAIQSGVEQRFGQGDDDGCETGEYPERCDRVPLVARAVDETLGDAEIVQLFEHSDRWEDGEGGKVDEQQEGCARAVEKGSNVR